MTIIFLINIDKSITARSARMKTENQQIRLTIKFSFSIESMVFPSSIELFLFQ
ncbi:hypothetical protein H1P_4670006 [Hyella patelloides LEGE 07179]|uniref:Uncharacterized protein n=1 Tax=Hyella patelloides LEGE 07179 TaxID=945734 RepID=A0A563VYS8_9CYAN|nr:hypothetical protein H1P_4670006 [Hyella patelloides LEGE 07179]